MNRLMMACLAATLGVAGCEQKPTKPGDEATTTQPAEGVSFEDVKEKAGSAATAAGQYLSQQLARLRDDAEDTLDRVNQRVSALRDRLEEAADEAKPEIRERIEQLKQQGADVRDKLGRLSEASGPALEELREGLSDAVDRLQDSLEEKPEVPTTQPLPEP